MHTRSLLHKRNFLFIFLLLCGSCLHTIAQTAQPSPKELRDAGMEYFNAGKHMRALKNFLRYQRIKPDDLEVKQHIGICYYYVNNVSEARKYLNYVVDNEKKPSEDLFLYLAKCDHAEHQFRQAIAGYKKYLSVAKKENNRPAIINDIKRCMEGMNLFFKEEEAIAENLGENINTAWDDFGAIISPANAGRIYFSSAREGNIGGLRNEKGMSDEANGTYGLDMFVTEYDGAGWATSERMSELLNSPRQDVILGFTNNGQVLYFYQGLSTTDGDILMDTFVENIEEKPLFPPKLISPVVTTQGDYGIQFVNDSTLIFASRRAGGYGGYDLYITTRLAEQWTMPQNLGNKINSAYDEVTPFLANDKRTLYFSCNSTKSIGGFDVFTSQFDADTKVWSTPQNMGMPVNSAGDDTYFRLVNDGSRAFLSSTRKESIGQRDIFSCSFKKPIETMQYVDGTLAFVTNTVASGVAETSTSEKIKITGSSSEKKKSPPPIPTKNENWQEFHITTLMYNDDNDILATLNQQELVKLATLLITYPQLKVDIVAHNYKAESATLEAYLTNKRAQKVAQFLIGKGVNAANISTKGCGANYAIAKNESDGKPNIAGQRFNRRIETLVYNTDGVPIKFTNINPIVGEYMQSDTDNRRKNTIKGLSYKVQVAATKQLYSNSELLDYSDIMVEANGDSETLYYTVGLYRTAASAIQLKEDLVTKGINVPKIIPYINGVRVSKAEAQKLASKYSDLNNYLADDGE